MFNEFDVIVVLEEIPGSEIKPGDVGTILRPVGNSQGYEVEFLNFGGDTIAIEVMQANQIAPIDPEAMMHARKL